MKTTFFLVRGGPMRLVNPAPILLGDQHHEGSVDRSVLAPADLSPYLPRAEVIFTGHAYAPTPSPFVPVRLAIVGSRPLVDKILHVFGERMWTDDEQMTAPVPFTRIPIRYERAYRGAPGIEENPVGMARGPGLPVHNIIDPSDPEAPAGLGAIAPYWPPRRRLLRNLDPGVLAAPQPALPDTFAWSFFHSAPADQRCSFFEGNEWVVLEGLNPEHPRFESQLPGGRARARLYSSESTSHREITLTADTLWIDGDRSLCCVLWRGNFEVEEGMLENAQVFAGLEMPGRMIPWPAEVVKAAPVERVAAAPSEATMASLGPAGVAVSPPGAPAASPYAQRPGSGQYGAVVDTATAPRAQAEPAAAPAGETTGTTQAFAPAGSLLAALAENPPPAEVGGSTMRARDVEPVPPGAPQPPREDGQWQPGNTLASPGALAQVAVAAAELRRQRSESQARGQAAQGNVLIESAPALVPDSGNSIEVDPRWLEPGRSSAVDPASLVQPSSMPMSGGSTMTHPPSELQRLINQTRHTDPVAPSPATVAHPNFDDSPTVAPDTGDLARILHEADEQALADAEAAAKAAQAEALPVGARPSPTELRAQKTTIRGLGRSPSGTHPAVIPPEAAPPTARATTSHLLQNEDLQTAQLPIPDVLLKLAAQPSSQRQPAPPSTPSPIIQDRTPAPADVDDDDTGRPTLTGMEAPPVSQLAQPAPQVHQGETRMEVERRIREGETLEGLDLSDLDLSGFDFSGKKLVACRFDRSNLRKCRLHGADLTGASLEGADLAETDLDDSILERTNLVSSKLTGATMRRAFLTDANLTAADARRVVLDQASGQRTIFARARLDGASANGVQLDTADFTEAQLDGASFEGALLPELKAYEVSAEDASFVRATLQNARFDGGVLGRARFDGASAEDSMWDRAVLDGASFEHTKLCGGSFTKASLRGANLSHADLGEARFNRANLNGAKFIGVDLGSLTLDGADLTGIVTNE